MSEKFLNNQTTLSHQAEAVMQVSRHEQFAAAYTGGLEHAQELGFDLAQALTAEGEGANRTIDTAERSKRIVDTAANIAAELRIEPTFYETASNTILFTGIAGAWVENEMKVAASPSHNSKLADERDMLVDASMVLVGGHSQAAREIGQTRPDLQDRYVEEVLTEDQMARNAFLDTILDDELAAQVTKVMKQSGPGSLLEKQREALGVTAEGEMPYAVRVLKVANRYELQEAGMLPEIKWPQSEDYGSEGLDKYRSDSKTALDLSEANDKMAQVYKDNEQAYEEKFDQTFGSLAPAFVNFGADGKKTLYLRTAEAYSLVHQFAGDKTPKDEGDLERRLAFARHEYAHTQKQLAQGAHTQLGLILEERKAELVSGDRHGYQDVKAFIADLSMAADQSLVDSLGEALKAKDARSAFLIDASSKVGLRNTLMIMLAKPLPYDNDPDYAKKFTSLTSQKTEEDTTTLDAIVRQDIEKRGDTNITRRATKWAEELKLDGEKVDFLRNFYFNFRRRSGSSHGTTYLEKAFEARVSREAANSTDTLAKHSG